jgi:excisionase family DNA binding protein
MRPPELSVGQRHDGITGDSQNEVLNKILTVLDSVDRRLEAVEQTLCDLNVAQREAGGMEWLSTAEIAAVVKRSEFTVRQWCAKGRLRGEKTDNGREWRVQRAELLRYRKEGLLPVR